MCEITYLQRATPSLSPCSRSEDGSLSPRVSSIHDRTSLAAAGVNLSSRTLRKSLSREETEAMATHAAAFEPASRFEIRDSRL
jgi:hypothetical protein